MLVNQTHRKVNKLTGSHSECEDCLLGCPSSHPDDGGSNSETSVNFYATKRPNIPKTIIFIVKQFYTLKKIPKYLSNLEGIARISPEFKIKCSYCV